MERLADPAQRRSGSDELIAAGRATAGRSTRSTPGVAFARDIGLDPVVTAGKGDEAIPSVRHPISFSATPASYPLPPPSLDQHGEADPRLAGRPPRPGTPRPPPTTG